MQSKFIEKLKQYYQDKSLILRYAFILLILFLILIQFVGSPSAIVKIDYNTLNFATEDISFDGKYIFNKERFDRELSFLRNNVSQFIMLHKREPLYMEYFQNELAKNGIPDDFKYLAVVESNLKINAISSAGAGGIRQLMPDTAIRYGLRVDSMIDERFDLEKSTNAAIKHFKRLYKMFENWTLVAAAYNRGENGLVKDMAKQYMTGFYDLQLNDETSRYVFRILATKYIMQNKEKEFDPKLLGEQYREIRTKTVTITGPSEDLALLAKQSGYSYYMIRQLNPRIIGYKLPEGEWDIKVLR